MMDRLLARVERFQREIIGYPIPETPRPLAAERLKARLDHISEERDEIAQSTLFADQVDGFLDLAYVALGALIEMGVLPGATFDEVDDANMAKVRGAKASRPGHQGYDAVKPEGWTPPDLAPYLALTKSDVQLLSGLSPVLRRVAKLRAMKGKDYNTGVQLTEYFPLGHASYFQMIFVKTKRMQSYMELINRGQRPNFEGIIDTVEDLINYATFYGEFLDAEKSAGQAAYSGVKTGG